MLVLWMLSLGPPAHAAPDLPRPRNCLRLDRGATRPPVPNPASQVSETLPIRVWYDDKDAPSVSRAPVVLEALERAWVVQVDQIGFRPPLLPDAADGPEFDVYLIDYQRGAAFVAADPAPDPIVGDGYSSASSFMVIDHRLPFGALAGFVAHELNHASQWTYDYTEGTLPIWEGTATAAEGWTLGPDSNWASPVSSFQEVPFAPTLVGDGVAISGALALGDYFEYGAAMWVVWLDEVFGDGEGRGGVALWEAAASEGRRREPDVVDAFGAVAGTSAVDALAQFAVPRFLTGDAWDPRGLSEAFSWRPRRAVPTELFSLADLPLVDHAPDPAPMITGQAFVDVDLGALSDDDARTLVVEVTSATALQSGLTVMWWATDGGAGDDVAVGVAPVLEIPAAGLVRVVVAVTNGGPAEWDGDDPPYVAGDQTVSVVLEGPPPAVRPSDLGASGAGCGCQPPAGAPLGWIALLGGLVATRRQQAL